MKQAVTSLLQILVHRRPAVIPAAPSTPQVDAYRLSLWPELPRALRVARVYRVLSRMSVRPMTPEQMVALGLTDRERDALLWHLGNEEAVEVVRVAATHAAIGSPGLAQHRAAVHLHRLTPRGGPAGGVGALCV